MLLPSFPFPHHRVQHSVAPSSKGPSTRAASASPRALSAAVTRAFAAHSASRRRATSAAAAAAAARWARASAVRSARRASSARACDAAWAAAQSAEVNGEVLLPHLVLLPPPPFANAVGANTSAKRRTLCPLPPLSSLSPPQEGLSPASTKWTKGRTISSAAATSRSSCRAVSAACAHSAASAARASYRGGERG